jgi:hypothetical protein
VKALLFLLLLVALPRFVWAEPKSEYEMKAAYLYNFALFAEWPEETFDAFSFCIFGDKEPFGASLSTIEKKSIRGKRIEISQTVSLTPLKKCHVLFVAERESHQMDRIVKEITGQPVLTVTESPRIVGSMIRLSLDNHRLVFDIDPEQVDKSGIKFSYKLLNLARNLRK